MDMETTFPKRTWILNLNREEVNIMKSRRLTKKLLAIGATVVLLLGAGVVTVFAVSQGAVAPKEATYVQKGNTIEAYYVYDVDA